MREFFNEALSESIIAGDMQGARFLLSRAEKLGLLDTPASEAEQFGMAALKDCIDEGDARTARWCYSRLLEIRK